MTETTTEQLAAIEGQAQYILPAGWQKVPLGEPLKGGDEYHEGLDRYIRRIESQPQPEPQPEPVQVREGRWRTRGGDIRNVTPTPEGDNRHYRFPWRDAKYDQTWTPNGRCQFNCEESPSDLVEYLGPIEPDKPQPQPAEYTPPEGWRVLAVGERLRDGDVTVRRDGYQYPTERVGGWVGSNQRYIRPIESQPQPVPAVQGGLVRDVTHLLEESGVLDLAKAEQRIEELRGEVSYVQRLLGESRQRVTQLEELVTSLRTINDAQEKTVRLAGQENTDLKHRLNVVSAEWAEQVETSRRLQIELDAAQQVPQAIADRFEEGWNQGTARAVETIIAWLEPIRLADSAYLANATMQHLPSIMRHLTGLAQD